MRRLRLLSVIGTRPEAIKLAPLAIAAAADPRVTHRLAATGQHDTIFDQALADFGLAADQHLAATSATVAEIRAAAVCLIEHERPDLVLVQGDTNSALAAALAATDAGVALGHVEAGLRSHDPTQPWPEEENRIAIDACATLLFAPTAVAAANLAAEPAVTGHVHVTGNTGIDALFAIRARAEGGAAADTDPCRLIFVTCHRRENIGEGVAGICRALRRLAERGDVRIVLPVHPNPAVAGPIRAALSATPAIALVDALAYPATIALAERAHLILSDSGGLQEEAPALGRPLLVLRDVTERPEGVASGNLRLVGTDPDRIVAEASRLLDDPVHHARMSRPALPFGDGRASRRILDAIAAWGADPLHLRPS